MTTLEMRSVATGKCVVCQREYNTDWARRNRRDPDTTAMKAKGMISVSETAELLGLPIHTIYSLRKGSVFLQPVYKAPGRGGALLYDPREAKAWLTEKTAERDAKLAGYITLFEVCRRTGMTRGDVNQYVRRGKFPQPVKIDDVPLSDSRLLYFKETEVEEWMVQRAAAVEGRITTAEVAQRAGLSRQSIRHTRGIPTPIRQGLTNYYLETEVEEWLENRKTAAVVVVEGRITTAEVAKRIGRSLSYIKSHLSKGNLPRPIKSGNFNYYLETDIEEWLEKRKH